MKGWGSCGWGERSRNKYPKPVSNPPCHSHCLRIPGDDIFLIVLLWATVSAALALGALGWGWGDILIFCILWPRALCSSACQQPSVPPLWASCQVTLHLAIALLRVLLVLCLEDDPQIWSQLNLSISLFPVREYSIRCRCYDWSRIFLSLTLIILPPFSPFFFFFSSPGHCCLNDKYSRKEPNISS